MNPVASQGRSRLVAAALKLGARGGGEAVTVRQIAEAAGVTEGALYKHFKSKTELYLTIYRDLVEEMIREKERIVAQEASLRQKLTAWVRVSYDYYDRNPDGFTFALLRDQESKGNPDRLTRRQGELFMQLIRSAQRSAQAAPMPPQLALSHFSGLLLNVPRLINQKVLPGPAGRYVEQVAAAAWRVLGPPGT